MLIHKIRTDEHPIAHNILASETVKSPALPLEGVDDVHRRHGLPPSVLSVGHGVSDHILEEDFEDSPGLLIDEAGDTLHASSTSQTANGRLGDPLDVIAKHLPICNYTDEHPIAHNSLASETVQSPALPLEGVDDVHRRHGLPSSVLSVGHGVSDHILEEDFEDSPGLLVDEAGDTLHASSTSQTANGRLGDPLDVVAKHLPVTLGSSLAQSLASLTTAGHFCRVKE
nr:histone H4 [Ipomoea batatas]